MNKMSNRELVIRAFLLQEITTQIVYQVFDVERPPEEDITKRLETFIREAEGNPDFVMNEKNMVDILVKMNDIRKSIGI